MHHVSRWITTEIAAIGLGLLRLLVPRLPKPPHERVFAKIEHGDFLRFATQTRRLTDVPLVVVEGGEVEQFLDADRVQMAAHGLAPLGLALKVGALQPAFGRAVGVEHGERALLAPTSGVTKSPSASRTDNPCSSTAFRPASGNMGATCGQASSNWPTSAWVSGAPLSPSTQHAPLHAAKSHAKWASNTSSLSRALPIRIIQAKVA